MQAAFLAQLLFPSLAPPRWKRKLDPPWKLRCFFGRKPNQQSSWFEKSFFQLSTQMSQPLLKMKGPPPKMQNWKKKMRVKLYLKSETICFPYWFLLAHRAQKTGGARATTTLFFWRKRKTKKHISFLFPFRVWFFTSQGDGSSMWFLFWVSPGP